MDIANVMMFAGEFLSEQENKNEPISEDDLWEYINSKSEVAKITTTEINEAITRLLLSGFIYRSGVCNKRGNLYSRYIPEVCVKIDEHKGEKTMPVYEFKCNNDDCGKTFAVGCSMDVLATLHPTCPECGKSNVSRKYSGIATIFKGKGFYTTDSRKGE